MLSARSQRIEPQPLQLISLRQGATLRPPVHPQLPNSTDTRACLHLWRQSGCLASLIEKMLTAQLISCLSYIDRSVCCQFAAGKWQRQGPSCPSGEPASHVQSPNRLSSLGTRTSASHAASLNIVQRRLVLSGPCLAPKGPKPPRKGPFLLNHWPPTPKLPRKLAAAIGPASVFSTPLASLHPPPSTATWSARLLLGTARDQS